MVFKVTSFYSRICFRDHTQQRIVHELIQYSTVYADSAVLSVHFEYWL